MIEHKLMQASLIRPTDNVAHVLESDSLEYNMMERLGAYTVHISPKTDAVFSFTDIFSS